jgi:hypothetical protein
LYNAFPIQNGLKQGDALSPLLFNFALEYTIRKVQENKERLINADNVNLLGEIINRPTIQKSTEASKKVGLEINADKIKYLYGHVSLPDCRKNHYIKMAINCSTMWQS